MAQVFSALFFDKLRGIAVLLLGLGILFMLGMNHFFPKPVELDDRTTEVIVNAAETMRKAANSMETTAQDNIQFMQSMQSELTQQAELRKSNYAALYEQYGIGSMPGNSGSSVAGSGFGLQPPPDFGRGGDLPEGTGYPGRTEQLPHPTADSGKATVGSNPGASGGSSNPPSVKGGATGILPGKQ